MNEIKCPHCGKAFKIDEAGYANILKQVRDADFEKQLHKRLELAEQEKQSAVELAKTKAANESQKAAATKEAEIQELKAKLEAGEVARKLAVTEALKTVENYDHYLTRFLNFTKNDNPAQITDNSVREFRLWLNRQSTGNNKANGETLSKKPQNYY